MKDGSSADSQETMRQAIALIQAGMDMLIDLNTSFADGRRLADAVAPDSDALKESGAPYTPSTGLMKTLLRNRVDRFGNILTQAEHDVLMRFAERKSPETIAERRKSNLRTVNNQLAIATRKAGFSDRRELNGWIEGVEGVREFPHASSAQGTV